jgi:hypothetical protein
MENPSSEFKVQGSKFKRKPIPVSKFWRARRPAPPFLSENRKPVLKKYRLEGLAKNC